MHLRIQQYIQQLSAEHLWTYSHYPSVLLENSMTIFFSASQSVAKRGGHALTKGLLTRPGLTATAGERGLQLGRQREKLAPSVQSRELVMGSWVDSYGRHDSHSLMEAPSGSHRIDPRGTEMLKVRETAFREGKKPNNRHL